MKSKPAVKAKKRRFGMREVFIIAMLAYPVLHFLVMWVFVNGYSISLTFQSYVAVPTPAFPKRGWQFAGLNNYINLIDLIKNDSYSRSMITTSLEYIVVSCFITLPVSIFSAYFIYKKIRFSSFFRIVFFFPSIIPLVILTLIFSMSVDPNYGIVNIMLRGMGLIGKDGFVRWLSLAGEPEARRTVFLFCIWAGIGYDAILLNSGMGKIPVELQESAMLDGAGPMTELFRIVIPLTWPTISTLFVLGMMSCINVYMQPLFLTGGAFGTNTIALEIFSIARNGTGNSDLVSGATLGFLCTLILAPIILVVKYLLEKCFADVEF